MKKVSIVGLDIAKNVFHAHGAAEDGSRVFSKRLPRDRVLDFLGELDRSVVAMEACGSAHHWGGEILALGHEVKLIHSNT